MTVGALWSARTAAERLMTDSCEVTRATGEPVLNEETGQYTAQTTTVYAGRCRVQASGVQARERDAGELFVIADRVVVALPMSASGLAKDDLVTITDAPHNAQLVGARYRVRSVQDKSQPTAVRLDCESA